MGPAYGPLDPRKITTKHLRASDHILWKLPKDIHWKWVLAEVMRGTTEAIQRHDHEEAMEHVMAYASWCVHQYAARHGRF